MMVTEELGRAMEKTVNVMAHKRTPYYIHIKVGDHYDGQPLANAVRGNATQEVMIGGQVIHTTITCFSCNMELAKSVVACNKGCAAFMGRQEDGRAVCPIIVPQLGTILFRMDNRRGEPELIYALPKDIPHDGEDSDNYGPVAVKVAESAMNARIGLVCN